MVPATFVTQCAVNHALPDIATELLLEHGARICGMPRPFPQAVQEVRPLLHHLAPLGKSLRLVVGRSNLVSLGVCQLELDHIWREALLVE